MGLVREVALNNLIGPGKALDAFLVAFRIPNLLRDLLAEGSLSNAFVSVFTKKVAREGKDAAMVLANKVVTLLLALMSMIVVLGIIFAPLIVSILGTGFEDPSKRELATHLTRIMFPFIFWVSLAAILMGLLNTLGSFGLPASASTVFNITSIVLGVSFAWLMDPKFGEKSIYGFACGTLLGGLAQALCMVPSAWEKGFRPRLVWDPDDVDVKEIGRLMLPAVLGGAAVQINVLVNTAFASFLESGTITFLSNAFRLMQLPIGLFGVAIATVTLPTISRNIAFENREAFRANLAKALRHALALGLPSAAGLAVLAEPIVEVIFQRGRFSAEDTTRTALALQGYAIGLAAYGCIKIVGPAFIALGKPNTPLRVSLIGIVINFFCNAFFVFTLGWGVFGLALSTSVVAIINLTQLVWKIREPLGGIEAKKLLITLMKILAACFVMMSVVWSVDQITRDLLAAHFITRAIRLLVLISMGSGSFLALAMIFKIDETISLLNDLKSRFRLPIGGA